MRIDKPLFDYIEYELYAYEKTKEEIELIREDIINSTNAAAGEKVNNSNISNITESKAIRLTTNTAILNMARTVEAIETALSKLTEDHQKIFTLKYKLGMNWRQVISEMPTSERSYFRLRKEIVLMVGQEMGKLRVG